MTKRRYATLDDSGNVPTEQLDNAAGGGPHAIQHAIGGNDALAPAAIGAAPTHAHPYEAVGTVATHALTPHGLASHAIDGAFHTGAEVLPTQGQKNALAGTQGTPGSVNPYVTTQDARLADARTPLGHAHLDADIPAGIARDAEVTSAVSDHAAAADPHPGYLTPAEGAAAYQPVDSDLTAIAALSTTPFGRALLALADAAALAASHSHGGGPASDPPSGSYAPGSFTLATGRYALMAGRLILTGAQRATLQGTARLRSD